MDGYLKIKTKIDNSNIDKGIKQLEDKIKKLQIDNSDLSQEQDNLQKEIDSYKELCNKVEEYKKEMSSLQKINKNGNVVVTDASKMAQLQMALAEANTEIDKQAIKMEKVNSKLNKIKSKQVENNSKIAEYRQQIERINMKNIQKGVDNVGKSITNQIGKLGKMAMAVFGIRTAFTAVTRAVNMVKQYNPQVAADFEYMGYCIANIVAPAVQKLIQLLYTVLSYVNAITTAWFGINLFANSSAKSFQKMKSSAKEIQKSLQGFDEMNVLSDSSSSDSNAGMPSMDLSGMQGEVPAWLQWIIDNKDLILSTLAGIAAGLTAIKLGAKGIKALGIGVMIAGIIELIQSVIAYINDPSWENFGKVISSIGVIITGIGIIISSVLGIAAGAPVIIAGIITVIVGLIVSNWGKIKQFLQNGIDWLNSKVDWVEKNFGLFGKVIYQTFIAVLQELLNMFNGIFSGVKTILDGILKVFKGIFTGDMKTVLEGFKQIFKGVFDALWSIAKVPLNLIIRGINSLIRGANKIKFDVPDWVPGFGGKQFGFNIKEIPLLAQGTVVSKPTPAIIGEAGAEAVVPLENNTEWLEKMADMISSKIGGNGTVNVYLDGRLIQRQMAKREQQLAFSTNS